MKILYAISLLSFCLLLWAAVAITRHIRRVPATPISPSDADVLPTPADPWSSLDPDNARRRFRSSDAAPASATAAPTPPASAASTSAAAAASFPSNPKPRSAPGARLDRRYSDGNGGNLKDPDNGMRRRFSDRPPDSGPKQS